SNGVALVGVPSVVGRTLDHMEQAPKSVVMPQDVSSRVGFFDRAAGVIAGIASRAPFFAFCVVLVLVWLAQGVVKMLAGGGITSFESSTYQLEINTTTTIITFLLVALLQ